FKTQAGAAQSYQLPGGTSFHHVLDRPEAGRHSLQSLFSRLGQTCVELLFCALECGSYRVCAEPGTVQRAQTAGYAHWLLCYHVLRAADGLAHACDGKTGGLENQTAGGGKRGRAAESGGDRAGAEGVGAHDSRWLRPDGDNGAGG